VSKFKADIYFDEIYVKTDFIEADDEYTALEDLAEKHHSRVTYDIEELDSTI